MQDKEEKFDRELNNCFICGINRSAFDGNSPVTFDEHVQKVHNKWSYLNFLVLLHTKDVTELTGPESAVHEMINPNKDDRSDPDLSWFPRSHGKSSVRDQTRSPTTVASEPVAKLDGEHGQRAPASSAGYSRGDSVTDHTN